MLIIVKIVGALLVCGLWAFIAWQVFTAPVDRRFDSKSRPLPRTPDKDSEDA